MEPVEPEHYRDVRIQLTPGVYAGDNRIHTGDRLLFSQTFQGYYGDRIVVYAPNRRNQRSYRGYQSSRVRPLGWMKTRDWHLLLIHAMNPPVGIHYMQRAFPRTRDTMLKRLHMRSMEDVEGNVYANDWFMARIWFNIG